MVLYNILIDFGVPILTVQIRYLWICMTHIVYEINLLL
jgi:hypothetical protein